jgi:predicted nucleotidyltransferase
MHAVFTENLPEMAILCRQYDVARLEVFGSAARADDFNPGLSDADFLVEFKPNSSLLPPDQYFGLARALEELLGRSVDLVQQGAVKKPSMLAEINRAREIVYAS